MADIRRAAASNKSGATLGVAMTLGVVGLLLCAAPAVIGWQRGQFAASLARHAGTATGGVAQLEVRQLAEAGLDATPALVRLAGSAGVAAAAARDSVEDQLAGWESELRATNNAIGFEFRLSTLSRALAAEIAGFDAAGRAWARRIALQIAPLSDRLTSRGAVQVLADCDEVLAEPTEPPATIAMTIPMPRGADQPDPLLKRYAHVPAVAAPTTSAATPLADADAPSDQATEGELQVVTPPASQLSIGSAASVAPLITDPMLSPDAGAVVPPSTMQTIPEIAPREAASAPGVRPLPPPEMDESLVDIPPPRLQRAILRRYRLMTDRELAAEFANAKPYDALVIEQVFRERQNEQTRVTARGPRQATRKSSGNGDSGEPLAKRVSKLPASDARRMLRTLATDASSSAETRLEALTLLATTGDPGLAEIARQRALEDADPRVADLAMRILRESEQAK